MKKSVLRLAAVFTSLAATISSALTAPFIRSNSNETERLQERFISKSKNATAVLLLPRAIYPKEQFPWLIAHGSHKSHVSHNSHVSHASGTSSRSYISPYKDSPWYYATPASPVLATVVKDVNLRKGPGTDYQIITVLHKGQKVIVTTSYSSWVKVTVETGVTTKSGWLNSKYIK